MFIFYDSELSAICRGTLRLSLKRFCRWAPRADRLQHSDAPQAQRWRAAFDSGEGNTKEVLWLALWDRILWSHPIIIIWVAGHHPDDPSSHIMITSNIWISNLLQTKNVGCDAHIWWSHAFINARKQKNTPCRDSADLFALREWVTHLQLTLGVTVDWSASPREMEETTG